MGGRNSFASVEVRPEQSYRACSGREHGQKKIHQSSPKWRALPCPRKKVAEQVDAECPAPREIKYYLTRAPSCGTSLFTYLSGSILFVICNIPRFRYSLKCFPTWLGFEIPSVSLFSIKGAGLSYIGKVPPFHSRDHQTILDAHSRSLGGCSHSYFRRLRPSSRQPHSRS